MKKQLLIFIGMVLFSFSCSEDMELQQSVFISDPNNPGLPKYSELGYNTFGAYYDREVFKSAEMTPAKVVYTGGVTSFTLYGEMDYFSELSITISMNDLAADQYSDLIDLHDTNLDLTGANYTVTITTAFSEEQAQILNGTFHFKRAQNLLVDKEQIGVILSGTFEFQALINGQPITMSDGRFDVTIGENNFYSF